MPAIDINDMDDETRAIVEEKINKQHHGVIADVEAAATRQRVRDLATKIEQQRANKESKAKETTEEKPKPPEEKSEETRPPTLKERLVGGTKEGFNAIFGTPEARAAKAAENAEYHKTIKEAKDAAELKKELARISGKEEKGSGKSKRKSKKDMFGEGDDDEDGSRSRGSKSSPVGTYESAYQHNKPIPYESAYAGKNVMSGHFQEAYIGKGMANGVYKSPGNPKTYDMSRTEPQQRQSPPRPPQPTPAPQRARAPPMPMPTIGSFGNGNIKMPTISLGGYGKVSNAHKMGPGNMPSINIPTLGGSTLMMGSGLMKKTANSKIGSGMFNVPTIGNWGKAPLKTKLETPNIGNLTIMGAGKKGGIGFGLGEVPRFGLAAPGKRKK